MSPIEFTVDIKPRGWARARRKGDHYFVDQRTSAAKAAVRGAYLDAAPRHARRFSGPVRIHVRALFPAPKRTPKRDAEAVRAEIIPHAVKPDADNVGKLVCDALNNVAYTDDAQVADLVVSKRLSDRPRLEISIEPLGPTVEELDR